MRLIVLTSQFVVQPPDEGYDCGVARGTHGEGPRCGRRPGDVDDLDELVAALRDATRRGILLRFYDDPSPRTVDDVAAAAGIHRTVAFEHLEQLLRLGFLEVARRGGHRGKPAKVYRLGSRAIRLQYPARQFVLLSTLLARALPEEMMPSLSRAARERGSQMYEAEDGTGADAVAAALARLGGRPEIVGDVVHAHNCVFREACAAAPAVICALQAAMLEGAMTAAGTTGRVEPLGADAVTGCAFRIASVA